VLNRGNLPQRPREKLTTDPAFSLLLMSARVDREFGREEGGLPSGPEIQFSKEPV